MSSATSTTTELRYLLNITFEDGHIIYQTGEDVSASNPIKSFWHDVICDGRKVLHMKLWNPNKTIKVDLASGLFAVNGEILDLQPLAYPLPPGGVFQPLYFRDNLVKITQEGIQSHTHKYRIGWTYEVDRPYQVWDVGGSDLGRGKLIFTQTIVID